MDFNDNFDGRDELVKARFGKDKLVAKAPSIDDLIKDYSEPWQKPYYNRFDDFLPVKMGLYTSCVDGIHGLRAWALPVTDVIKTEGVASCFDQVKLGIVEITEVPDYEEGTTELLICIHEVDRTPA